MRYQEIASGLRIPISCEETELIDRGQDGLIAKEDLDEREQEVARLLVSRGVLDQFPQKDQVFYHVSSVYDIGRGLDG